MKCAVTPNGLVDRMQLQIIAGTWRTLAIEEERERLLADLSAIWPVRTAYAPPP